MRETEATAVLRRFIGMNASDFVPHREPLLLVDSIIDIGSDFTVCDWLVRDSAFMEPNHGVPAYTAIETMAQCTAVHAGVRARMLGLEPPIGLLLGTRRFECSVGYLGPGQRYLARCDVLARDEQGMSSFACELLNAGKRIASAKLAVLERLPG